MYFDRLPDHGPRPRNQTASERIGALWRRGNEAFAHRLIVGAGRELRESYGGKSPQSAAMEHAWRSGDPRNLGLQFAQDDQGLHYSLRRYDTRSGLRETLTIDCQNDDTVVYANSMAELPFGPEIDVRYDTSEPSDAHTASPWNVILDIHELISDVRYAKRLGSLVVTEPSLAIIDPA